MLNLLTAAVHPRANYLDDKSMRVSMRLIGHHFLLSIGDSTSRVLPITKEEARFKIPFSTEFSFNPTDLVKTVIGVVEETDFAHHFIVEVEQCLSHEVVYSFEVQNTWRSDLVPCAGRVLPKSCYNLFITLFKSDNWQMEKNSGTILHDLHSNMATKQTASASDGKVAVTKNFGRGLFVLLLLSPLILIGSLLHFRRKNGKVHQDPDLVSIGDYQFNKRNMTLLHKEGHTELTSKEADLLTLLYDASNQTVKREKILKAVWGDDGDYTGRTLDVFISKLRKRLMADPNLKIINIRGVGYKFVMNQ